MKASFIKPILILALASSPLAHSQTVAWGTSVNFTPLSFDSDGSVDNQSNLWTIGYFNNGFVPDTANFLDWAANWNPVSSPTPEADPLDPSADLINFPFHRSVPSGFTGSEVDEFWSTSVNTFDVGEAAGGRQIYMFAYNDINLIGTPQGEALLYREDGLLLPTTPNQITFDVADNPLDTNDDNFTVIWGQVDRRIDDLSPSSVLRGGGEISQLLTDSSSSQAGFADWETQFATWPIPEPSTTLLVVLSSLGLLRRRR